MQLIRGLHNLTPYADGCVVTIGNFDGVHLGHQAVLKQLIAQATKLNLPSVVMVFEPQPQEFFMADRAPARLMRLSEKVRALSEFAIDTVLVLRFNQALASLSPEAFIQQILLDGLNIKHLIIGDDFRFGKDRAGDFQTLVQAGQGQGFDVVSTHTYQLDDQRVSSTMIRTALARGDFDQARRYLGRPYRVCGRVAHGQKRGRTIGFPTANIFLQRLVTPLTGVFAVKMHGLAEHAVTGVANLGTRPTVDGTTRVLEVHLFDFDQVIYGHQVEVEFVKKLRDEQRFDTFDALKAQIEQDAIAARQCF